MKQALQSVARRIRLLRSVHGLLIGLLVGACACLALTVVSFFVPIEGVWRYLLAMLLGCALLGTLIGALWPVTRLGAARRADGCGLKERSVTALALAGEDSPMARLQREDAEAHLKALPIREAMPVRADKRLWLPVLFCALAVGILLVVPNPQHDVLRARTQTRAALKAQAEEIEEAAEAMEQADMTEDERTELRRITSEMAQALRESDDSREALERLDEKQQEMDKLREQMDRRASENLSQALSEQSALDSLAKAMEGGSQSAMQEAMAAIAEMMETGEGQEALSEQLQKAAEAMGEGAAKEALESAAAAAMSGDASQMAQALSSLSAAAGMGSGQMASAGNTGANLEALMRMARSGAAMAGTAGTSGSVGQGTAGASRPSRGTTNQDAGYREGFSQSAQNEGNAPIENRIRDYERIYDPNRLGGDNDPSLVKGQENEGESQQLELGPGLGNFSGAVPYNEVIGEYRDAAAQAMQRTVLPAALQEWVERYFNALID